MGPKVAGTLFGGCFALAAVYGLLRYDLQKRNDAMESALGQLLRGRFGFQGTAAAMEDVHRTIAAEREQRPPFFAFDAPLVDARDEFAAKAHHAATDAGATSRPAGLVGVERRSADLRERGPMNSLFTDISRIRSLIEAGRY
jgi:hypothetical protein